MDKDVDPNGVYASVENLDMGLLRRKNDVESMWERGTQGLVELGKTPGLLAKLERAERAAEAVEGM